MLFYVKILLQAQCKILNMPLFIACRDWLFKAHLRSLKRPNQGRWRWFEERNVNPKIDFDSSFDTQKFQSCSGGFTDSNVKLPLSNLGSSWWKWKMTSALRSLPGMVLVHSFFMKNTWYVNWGVEPVKEKIQKLKKSHHYHSLHMCAHSTVG